MIDLKIIKSYLDSGLSVIPVNGGNGKTPKAPAVSEWKGLMKERMSDDSVERYFSNAESIGIIGGKVSGDLTIIDFDNHDKKAKERFSLFLNQFEDIIKRYSMPYESTPSGGYHIYMRSYSSTGNKKLAQIPSGTRTDTIIETRGQGGYVVSSPSKGYEMMFGSLLKIPKITDDEENRIFSFCTSFNEIVEKEVENSPEIYPNSESRPGDEYNLSDRAIKEIPAILEHSGWKKGGRCYWVRPGKEKKDGISATFGKAKTPNGIPLFHVFSSNAYPFEDGKNYTPFAVFSILEHNGKFSDAAKELVDEGFGTPYVKEDSYSEIPKSIKEGMEAQRAKIETAVEEKAKSKKGKKSSIAEAKEFLSNTWDFRLNIINNTIQSKRKGALGWEELNENDIWMEVNEYGIKMSKDNVKSILGSSFVHEYNPFVDYFKNLPEYDGTDWFSEITKYIDVDDPSFFSIMLAKHCVRAIKCALEDDYYNRIILTIQSEKQEIGKSRFVHWINPFGNRYYSEQPLSDNKDCQIALSQTFIYNLDELHEMKNKNSSFIKSVLSKFAVFERKPYASQATLMPRRCTFFASTNRTNFLTDSVNTRWLIFKVDAISDALWAKINIDDVWSQAWALYNDKDFVYELTIDEKAKREERNKSFMEVPLETGLILRYFTKSENNWMMVSDIIKELITRVGYGIRVTNSTLSISSQLDALGFESKEENIMNIKIKYYKIAVK